MVNDFESEKLYFVNFINNRQDSYHSIGMMNKIMLENIIQIAAQQQFIMLQLPKIVQ